MLFDTRTLAALFLLIAVATPAARSRATPLRDPIVIGQTTSLTGPTAAFAKPVTDGIRATFEAVNRSGGIAGRPIKFVALDDGFDASRAVDNATRLVDQEGAVALLGPSGAPTTQSLSVFAANRRVALIGPTQGVPTLRGFEPTRFYLRASYRDEVQLVLRHLNTVGVKRVGVAYFDNPFGQQGAVMVQEEAQALGITIVGAVPVSQDLEKTANAARELAPRAPQAILLYTLAAPAAEFIRAYRPLATTQFYSLSVASADALYGQIADASQGVIVAQLFPAPTQMALGVVANCVAALAHIGITAPGYAHIEGCVIGAVTVEGLRRASPRLGREELLNALASAHIKLGGYDVKFGPKARNGSTFVELTMIGKGGQTVR